MFYGGYKTMVAGLGLNETYQMMVFWTQRDWEELVVQGWLLSLAHRAEEGGMFGESQYLGLFKLDPNTG
jgi:hypothetical protein